MHILKSINKGDTTLEDIEKEQIELKRYLSHINKKKISDEQKMTVDNIKIFMTQEKKLFSCLMIMLRRCLKIFTNQNN